MESICIQRQKYDKKQLGCKKKSQADEAKKGKCFLFLPHFLEMPETDLFICKWALCFYYYPNSLINQGLNMRSYFIQCYTIAPYNKILSFRDLRLFFLDYRIQPKSKCEKYICPPVSFTSIANIQNGSIQSLTHRHLLCPDQLCRKFDLKIMVPI